MDEHARYSNNVRMHIECVAYAFPFCSCVIALQLQLCVSIMLTDKYIFMMLSSFIHALAFNKLQSPMRSRKQFD